MITLGPLPRLGPWLGAAAADGAATAGSSQSSAIVALIVGVTSGLAAMYSIIRQARGDRAQERAAATSIAAEANTQSFTQVMALNTTLEAKVSRLETQLLQCREQIDAKELELAEADEVIAKAKKDNARLRKSIIDLEGTP